MLKRRRGAVLKCAGVIVAFWFGFAFYTGTVARSRDSAARSMDAGRRTTPRTTYDEGGRPHMPMPLPLTVSGFCPFAVSPIRPLPFIHLLVCSPGWQ